MTIKKQLVIMQLFFLALVLFSAQVSKSSTDDSSVDTKKSAISLYTEIGLSSNLYKPSSNSYEASSSFLLMPSYKLSEKNNLVGMVQMAKDLTGYREESLDSSSISWAHSLGNFGPKEMFSHAVIGRFYLPINSESRAESTLITKAHTQLNTNADLSKVGLKKSSFTHQVSLAKSFHHYKTSFSGKINNEYSFVNKFIYSYSLLEKIGLSTVFALVENFNYAKKRSETYAFDLSASYDLNSNSAISFGISTNGSTFKSNGVDSNVELIDSESSEIYSSLSYQF